LLLKIFYRRELEKIYSYIDRVVKQLSELRSRLDSESRRLDEVYKYKWELVELVNKVVSVEKRLYELEKEVERISEVLKNL
jgi:hypothetical protein